MMLYNSVFPRCLLTKRLLCRLKVSVKVTRTNGVLMPESKSRSIKEHVQLSY